MPSFNSCTFMGHLGADPELRHLQNGSKVCEFSIAVGEKWKDGTGATKERTDWIRAVCWESKAEVAAKYLAKGMPVQVQGRLRIEEYEKDGQKRTSVKCVVSTLTLLQFKEQEEGGAAPRSSRPAQQQSFAQPAGIDDDIPF